MKRRASRVILKKSYDDYGLGKPDKWKSEFVSLKSDIDKVLKDSNGDVKFISEALGIPADQIKGGELIRIDFKLSQRNKVFMPSGNEWGANPKWIPGGRLPTGKFEAIVSLDGLIEGKDFVISAIKLKK